MELHCGVDLHGDNGYWAVMDRDGKRVFGKRLPNSLDTVLATLEPFREELVGGVVVESTFNWYWLVDGLNEHGIGARLANPAAMEQYDGLKNTDDKTDAFFLTELSRLGILPEGFIYPKEERPVRDLLRRRLLLVRQKTAHTLSFQNLVARERGEQMSAKEILKLWPKEVAKLFEDERLVLMGQTNIEMIRFLNKQIRQIERVVLAEAKLKPQYEKLLTVPGITAISYDEWSGQWFWSFTDLSMRRLLLEHFADRDVAVETFGNVLAATAFLQGIATQELSSAELDQHDPKYPCTITARAVRR